MRHNIHYILNPHSFTEALSVVTAGEVEVAVQVEVVRGELSHSHDGLFTAVLDGVRSRLLLGLPHQTFLQTGDDLALRVYVLHREQRSHSYTLSSSWTKNKEQRKLFIPSII